MRRAFVRGSRAIAFAFLLPFAFASYPAPAAADDAVTFTLQAEGAYSTAADNCAQPVPQTVLFAGTENIVVSVTIGIDSYHLKIHANGKVTGDVIAPAPQVNVYSGDQTFDNEDNTSLGNDVYTLTTTFNARNLLDPKLNMILVTVTKVNLTTGTFTFQSNAKCDQGTVPPPPFP